MSEHIGFRCPEYIALAIANRMHTQKASKSEVVVELLKKGLGIEEEFRAKYENLEARIADLEDIIKSLKTCGKDLGEGS